MASNASLAMESSSASSVAFNDQDATTFADKGYFIIQNAFAEDYIDNMYRCCIEYYDYIMNYLRQGNLDLGIGIKHGYKEIVQRHLYRYEIAINDSIDLTNIIKLLDLIPRIIFGSDDYYIANKSIIISLPGSSVLVSEDIMRRLI